MRAARRRERGFTPIHGFTLIELLVALAITAIIFAMGYGAINQALKDRDSLAARQRRLTAVQNAMRVLVQDFTQLAPRPVRDALGQSSLPCLMGSPNGISLTAGSLGESGGGLGTNGGLGSDGLGPSGGLGANGGLGTSNGLGAGGGLGTSGGLGSGALGADGGLGSSFGSSASSSSSSSSDAGNTGDETSSGGGAGAGTDSQTLDLVVFTRAGWANPAGIQRPALARVSYRLENGTLRRLVWPELDIAQATTPIVRDLLDHVKSVQFRYLTDARQWTDQWPPLTNVVATPLEGNQILRWRPLAVEVTLDLDDWGKIVRIIEVAT